MSQSLSLAIVINFIFVLPHSFFANFCSLLSSNEETRFTRKNSASSERLNRMLEETVVKPIIVSPEFSSSADGCDSFCDHDWIFLKTLFCVPGLLNELSRRLFPTDVDRVASVLISRFGTRIIPDAI